MRRKNDRYIIQLFYDIGYTGIDLIILNRVRLYLQIYCLSDILLPGGTHVGHRYIHATGPNEEEDSIYKDWPIEYPTKQNKMLWSEAIQRITSQQFVLETRLGKWSEPPHRTQRWFYDAVSDTVYHERGNYVDEYASVDNGRLTRSGRIYRRSAISTNIPTNLPWCAVSTKRDGIIQLNNADSPRDIYSQPIPATTVRELLHEWKGDWIWDKLEIQRITSQQFVLETRLGKWSEPPHRTQ